MDEIKDGEQLHTYVHIWALHEIADTFGVLNCGADCSVPQGDEKMIKPFSNGTEYMDWRDNNCSRCKKDCEVVGDTYITHCDIEEAISLGTITGQVPDKIYERMGLPDSWDCPERK